VTVQLTMLLLLLNCCRCSAVLQTLYERLLELPLVTTSYVLISHSLPRRITNQQARRFGDMGHAGGGDVTI
jgi:hypothetical protein